MSEAEEIEKIRKAIRKHISDMLPIQTEYATVVSVDWKAKTCVVKDSDGLTRDKILLSLDGSEMDVKKPKINTQVVVAIIENQEAVGWVVEMKEFEIWHLNGDKFGGLPNWLELKKQLEIERKRVDGIINALNSAQAATGAPDSGTGLSASIKAGLIALKQKGDFSNVESKTIFHG